MWAQFLDWEDSPGGGSGNPLQYSCLENSMDRRAWQTIIHGVTKNQTWLKWLSTHALFILIQLHKSHLPLLRSWIPLPCFSNQTTPLSHTAALSHPGLRIQSLSLSSLSLLLSLLQSCCFPVLLFSTYINFVFSVCLLTLKLHLKNVIWKKNVICFKFSEAYILLTFYHWFNFNRHVISSLLGNYWV